MICIHLTLIFVHMNTLQILKISHSKSSSKSNILRALLVYFLLSCNESNFICILSCWFFLNKIIIPSWKKCSYLSILHKLVASDSDTENLPSCKTPLYYQTIIYDDFFHWLIPMKYFFSHRAKQLFLYHIINHSGSFSFFQLLQL